MALCAAHPEAKKSLGRLLGLNVRLESVEGIVHRPSGLRVVGVAKGRQHLRDHHVPGRVLVQAAIDPLLVAIRPIALPCLTDLEQVSQLDSPEQNELGAGQQPIDQAEPLVVIFVGQELANLLGGRLLAGQVQRDPPQKGRVAGRRAGRDLRASSIACTARHQ